MPPLRNAHGQRSQRVGPGRVRVINRGADTACKCAEKTPVRWRVVRLGPVGQARPRHAHHSKQGAAGIQRRSDDRRHPHPPGRRLRARVGCRAVLLGQVGDKNRIEALHRLLAKMPLRVADLLAHLRPGSIGRRPPPACRATLRISTPPWNRSTKQWSANCGTSNSATCCNVAPISWVAEGRIPSLSITRPANGAKQGRPGDFADRNWARRRGHARTKTPHACTSLVSLPGTRSRSASHSSS